MESGRNKEVDEMSEREEEHGEWEEQKERADVCWQGQKRGLLWEQPDAETNEATGGSRQLRHTLWCVCERLCVSFHKCEKPQSGCHCFRHPNQRKTSTFKKATTTVMLIGAFHKDTEDSGWERRGREMRKRGEKASAKRNFLLLVKKMLVGHMGE